MTPQTTLAASAFACLAFAAPALSQDQQMFELPKQCSGMAMSGMDGPDMPGATTGHDTDHGMDHGMEMGEGDARHDMMPDHVRENMRKMLLTMPAMRRGMMQQDADIAFACGMIAHHQAAIDMAEVVLDHGEDAQMRSLAEEIIAVQEEEIDAMKTWLENASD